MQSHDSVATRISCLAKPEMYTVCVHVRTLLWKIVKILHQIKNNTFNKQKAYRMICQDSGGFNKCFMGREPKSLILSWSCTKGETPGTKSGRVRKGPKFDSLFSSWLPGNLTHGNMVPSSDILPLLKSLALWRTSQSWDSSNQCHSQLY